MTLKNIYKLNEQECTWCSPGPTWRTFRKPRTCRGVGPPTRTSPKRTSRRGIGVMTCTHAIAISGAKEIPHQPTNASTWPKSTKASLTWLPWSILNIKFKQIYSGDKKKLWGKPDLNSGLKVTNIKCTITFESIWWWMGSKSVWWWLGWCCWCMMLGLVIVEEPA